MVMQNPKKYPLHADDEGFSALAGSLSVVLIVALWLNVGPLLASLPFGTSFLGAYLRANAPFFAMALGILLSARFLLKSGLRTLIRTTAAIKVNILVLSGGTYLGVCVAFTLLGWLIQPEYYRLLSDDIPQKLVLLPFVLLITPLQTTCEEFLMRIIPSRLFNRGHLVHSRYAMLLVSLFTALLFTLPHLSNQEMLHAEQTGAFMLYYALFGFAGTYISLRTGGFESSLGIHAANNLYIALICNYQFSSLPSKPLILSTAPLGTYLDVVQLFIAFVMVVLVLKKSRCFPPREEKFIG